MGVRGVVFDVFGLKGAPVSVTLPTNTLRARVSDNVRSRLRSALVLSALVAGVLSVGFVPSAMAGDACVNARVRVQTGSTGLPDCRSYEMVSAPYKEGFPILPGGNITFTEDGIVSYFSRGAFAGEVLGSPANVYHASRSAAGWTTSAIDPPATIYNTGLGDVALTVFAESADLRWSLWRMYRRADETPDDVGFWLRGPDGAFTRIGDGTFVTTVSDDDLSHVIVDGGEYVGTGHDGPPRPVGVDNGGQPLGAKCFRDVSGDGRVIVVASGCDSSAVAQLWARVGGSATVAVSASECTRDADDDGGLCNGVSAASYAGGAADGSRLFFITSQQLVNSDIDQTNDLYACDIPAGTPVPVGPTNPCASLTEVSGAARDGKVERVISVSQDGSRVYFVAQGVLADNLDVGGVGARAGAENLYVWDRDGDHPAGQIRYVARLATDDLTAQMTPDGRYLLLVTANSLVAADDDVLPGGPAARDVYRYDAVTHAIARVSTSVAGGGGNAPGVDASIPAKSAISADGSTVIFNTAEALSASDTNDGGDVYSWRDGQVSLISAGGGSAVGVTPSGRDLFFVTAAQVLGADRDANSDIYDARLGGGFAPVQTPPPCFGDQCQSERSRAPGLAGPSTVVPGSGVADVMPAFSVRAVSAAQRRVLATTGKVSLMVTSDTPGTITAKATMTSAGRAVGVGSGRQTLASPGKVAVTLTLSKTARRQLASRGRLTVKIAVSHSKVALDRSMTLKLAHAKTRAKRSAKRPVGRISGGQS